MRIMLLILALVLAGPALAQQASIREQVLSDRLLVEMNANMEARVRVLQLQAEIADLKAKLEKATSPKAPEGPAAKPD